jgi:response regulator RpfG family c-di-GMP phosphodiesterase
MRHGRAAVALFGLTAMQHRMSILVVDSNAERRALCRQLLEPDEYKINEVVGVLATLARVRERKPDLVIVDGTMANPDGLECARRLKSDPTTCDVPIVALVFTEEEIAAALQAGVNDYVVKPLHHREFVLRVRALLHQGQQNLELLRSRNLLGEHARVMTVLLEFAQHMAMASELDTVLEETVSVAAQLTCCRRVSIMLPDAEEKSLTIAKSIGIDDEIARKISVPVGAATSGQVYLSGEAVVVNTTGGEWCRGYDSSFFASTPLISRALSAPERVVGVLNITERQNARPFTLVELEYIDLISNVAGWVIDDLVTRRARDESRESIAVGLAKLAECRDSDTGMHLDRVSAFALILAEDLRHTERFRAVIDDRFLADLKRAVPLHDIGKVAIPDRILLKPGEPTAEETVIMQRHPEVGAETIRLVTKRTPGARFLKMAEEIAHAHHEWYDGSGYPRGLRGEEIPLAARIAALADVYDALTTKRPYKEAMGHDVSAKIIRKASGSQFDPDIIAAFLRCEAAFIEAAARLADPDTPAETPQAEPEGPQLVISP